MWLNFRPITSVSLLQVRSALSGYGLPPTGEDPVFRKLALAKSLEASRMNAADNLLTKASLRRKVFNIVKIF